MECLSMDVLVDPPARRDDMPVGLLFNAAGLTRGAAVTGAEGGDNYGLSEGGGSRKVTELLFPPPQTSSLLLSL